MISYIRRIKFSNGMKGLLTRNGIIIKSFESLLEVIYQKFCKYDFKLI